MTLFPSKVMVTGTGGYDSNVFWRQSNSSQHLLMTLAEVRCDYGGYRTVVFLMIFLSTFISWYLGGWGFVIGKQNIHPSMAG